MQKEEDSVAAAAANIRNIQRNDSPRDVAPCGTFMHAMQSTRVGEGSKRWQQRGMKLRCTFGLSLRWEFAALGVENNADDEGRRSRGLRRIGGPKVVTVAPARLRVEKGLHKEIVAGVQEYAVQTLPDFQAHQGEEKVIPAPSP